MHWQDFSHTFFLRFSIVAVGDVIAMR